MMIKLPWRDFITRKFEAMTEGLETNIKAKFKKVPLADRWDPKA